MSEVFIVKLDHPRAIRWTFGAQAKLGSLPRPPDFSDLANKRKAYSALCSFVWAALVDKRHTFEGPEDLAEHLDTPEKVKAASEAFMAAFKAANANPTKKAEAEPAPSPASNSA